MSWVAVLVVHNTQVLICKRSARVQYKPAWWNLPGGSVDPGESPVEAAERELREEAGITCQNLELFCDRADVRGQFFIARYNGAKITLNWEHTDFGWVGDGDIRRMDHMYCLPSGEPILWTHAEAVLGFFGRYDLHAG